MSFEVAMKGRGAGAGNGPGWNSRAGKRFPAWLIRVGEDGVGTQRSTVAEENRWDKS